MIDIARPRKHRNVCKLPENNRFGPLGMSEQQSEFVVITIDQYETIRLIDLEGLTQEECSDQMHIARTTVQRIYSNARKKIAEAIVEGKALKIEGGDYKLCNGQGQFCGRGKCNRGRGNIDSLDGKIKERSLMKIVIPVNEKSVDVYISENFGRAEYFLVYDTESKEKKFIVNTAVQSSGGAGIKAAQIVIDTGAGVLITPRCGQNAADVVSGAGIKIYKSVEGTVESNIKAYEEEKLNLLNEIHSGFHDHEEQ